MNYFLALETSNTITSIALFEDSNLVFNQELALQKHKNKYLFTAIGEILKYFDLEIKDLEAVILAAGPGSYTGLRIGTALAKGLCFGGGIPLISVDTLAALASQAREQVKNIFNLEAYHFLALLDARRNKVYAAAYDYELTPVLKTQLLDLGDKQFQDFTKPCFIFGDGARKWQAHYAAKYLLLEAVYPQAKYLIDLGLQKYSRKDFEDLAYFTPKYLKDFIPGKAKAKL